MTGNARTGFLPLAAMSLLLVACAGDPPSEATAPSTKPRPDVPTRLGCSHPRGARARQLLWVLGVYSVVARPTSRPSSRRGATGSTSWSGSRTPHATHSRD